MTTINLMENIINRKIIKEEMSLDNYYGIDINKLVEEIKTEIKKFMSSKFNPLYNNINSYYKVIVREPKVDSSDAVVIEVTLTKEYFKQL